MTEKEIFDPFQPPRVLVIGGGSWATALVKILTENLVPVHWYLRNEAIIQSLRQEGHNHRYLSDVHFDPATIMLYADINEAVRAAEIIVLAVPSAFFSSTLSDLEASLDEKMVFSAIKGIIPESGLIVGEHLHREFGLPYSQIGVITGPCHAEEVAMEKLSYLTLACSEVSRAQALANCMASHYIKTYVSDDIYGTEYAAVLKNIYAIAAGIAHGLGYGDNFISVLISNAIRETQRFIDQAHPIDRNINGSAYLGDLLVTAYSPFSRNRMFGNMLGKGYTVRSAIMEMNMIAEGYYAAKSAYEISQGFDEPGLTPIIDSVYAILYKKASPKTTFRKVEDAMD